MKVLVLLSCALAVASAGYEGIYKHPGPYAELGPNGIPIETPEVKAAKYAHLVAHASARGLPYAPINHGYAPGIVAVDGTPLDTPEVAQAKAHHFAAYNEAASRNGAVSYYAAPYSVSAAGPIDTPEVQQAKAAHFSAYNELAARNSYPFHYRKKRSAYSGPQHIPLLTPHGVPVETPEVQAAKAYHYAALADASTRAYAHPAAYTGYSGHYHGPIHVPVIGPNGVPLDTPEVQHAKAAHYAALANGGHHGSHTAIHGSYVASPYRYNGEYGYADIGHDGAPVETPEVQAAKAAHFAAHEAAIYSYE